MFWKQKPFFALMLALTMAIFNCQAAFAENEGQDDLDKASEAKVNATGIKELSEVIKLLDSAISKGLDKENNEFAENLLVESLLERATMLSGLILDTPRPHPQWAQIRQVVVMDLKRILALNEKQMNAQLLLGRLMALPGGDKEVAKKALDTVIESKEADGKVKSQAYVSRAGLFKKKEDRLDYFNKAVDLMPKNPELLVARAQFHLDNKEFKEAVADLDKAIALEPEKPGYHVARGLALMMNDQYDEALQSFDKAIEIEPKNAMPHLHRARVLALQKKYDASLKAMETALELSPDMLSVYLLRAQVLLSQEKPEEAMEAIDELLELRPGLIQALRMKASILAGTNRVSEAIETLKQVYQHSPNNAEVAQQLAMFYMLDKKNAMAVDVLTKLLKTTPKDADVLRSRADAYLNMGKHKEAIADYEAAIKNAPKDSGILNNYAWVLATSPVDALRNGKRAIEVATKACEETKYKKSHILSTLAAAYAEAGDFENAIKWSTKAVEVSASDKDADGNPRDPEELSQLQEELKSYKNKKPWRELQNEDEEGKEEAPPEEETPSEGTIDF